MLVTQWTQATWGPWPLLSITTNNTTTLEQQYQVWTIAAQKFFSQSLGKKKNAIYTIIKQVSAWNNLSLYPRLSAYPWLSSPVPQQTLLPSSSHISPANAQPISSNWNKLFPHFLLKAHPNTGIPRCTLESQRRSRTLNINKGRMLSNTVNC